MYVLTCSACTVALFRGAKYVIISTTSSIEKDLTASSGDIVEIHQEACQTDTSIRLKPTGVRAYA